VQRSLSALPRYAVALVAAGAALLIAFTLRDVLEPGIFPPFLVGVTVAALYGGLGPALVATVVSLAASYWFFLAPLYSFAWDDQGLSRLLFYRMGTFSIASLLIIVMATGRTRAIEAMRRARAEIEAGRQRMTFLAESSDVLGGSLDYEETLTSVVRLAVPFLADWCSLDVREKDGSIRRVAVSHADPGKAELAAVAATYPADPYGRHPRTVALRTGRSQLVPDVTDEWLKAIANTDEQLEVLRRFAYRSAMVVPLVARGETLGVMTFATIDSARRYDAGDLGLAEDLARRCALAVDNARLYREAQDANRSKDRFLATVSHELRSPLSAVLTWAHLLKSGRLDEAKTKRALATIESSARLQVRLIEDLIDISRVSSGKLSIERGPVDLRAVLEASIEVVRAVAEGKRIRVAFQADAAPCGLQGDAARLQQVFGNLLGNALKFTPEEGSIRIELVRLGDRAVVSLQDSGIGITPEQLQRIFEPFQQADEPTGRKSGIGLGLAIARHLIERHGGTIKAESAGQDQGSRFTISLPLDPAESNEQAVPSGVATAR
jgi:signal transduction histidine kinase